LAAFPPPLDELRKVGDRPLRVKNTRSGIGRFAPNRAIVEGDIGGRQELAGEDYSSRRRHQPPCQG
jgi:hypothetical protein